MKRLAIMMLMNPQQNNPNQSSNNNISQDNTTQDLQTDNFKVQTQISNIMEQESIPKKRSIKQIIFVASILLNIILLATVVFLIIINQNDQNRVSSSTNSTNANSSDNLEVNTNDNKIKSIVSQIVASIVSYQANNNGKIPSDVSAAKVIINNSSVSLVNPTTGKTYILTNERPNNNEIQYVVGKTCNSDDLVDGSMRSFAIRIQLESGKIYCASS